MNGFSRCNGLGNFFAIYEIYESVITPTSVIQLLKNIPEKYGTLEISFVEVGKWNYRKIRKQKLLKDI